MFAMNSAAPRSKPGHITIRTSFLSFRVNYRVLGFALLAIVVLTILATWAMTLGSFRIPFDQVVDAVRGKGDERQELVVRTLRMPRVLCAMLIGASLAMAGAIFQGLVRNPLVSPDIIGIDAGATVVAVAWIIFGLPYSWLPFAAFLGAILTASCIYIVSWRGGINPDRLILVGIGFAALLAALTTWITIAFPIEIVRPALVWTMGSVYGSTWSDVRVLSWFLVILGPMAVVLMWRLRIVQLGDDITRGLGVRLEFTRLLLIMVGCGLAACAIAIAGPIGFVALMVPHIARMLAGPLSGSVLVLTAVLGGIFLLGSDVIAQHFLPVALPVGVVTSAVGAPYFLFLLYRSNVRM